MQNMRTVLHFHPNIAPITALYFPSSEKDNLNTMAMNIYHNLCPDFDMIYDQNAGISRSYRKMDTIGNSYCIVMNYDRL